MGATQLETQFDAAMMEIYQRAKAEANYVATIFHQLLCAHGGLATARRLINDRTVSSGYTALWERGRLDLTVGSVVCDNAKWHPLFEPEEIEKAKSAYISTGISKVSNRYPPKSIRITVRGLVSRGFFESLTS